MIIDEHWLVREGLKFVLTGQGFRAEAQELSFTAALRRFQAGCAGIDLLLGDPGANLDSELESVRTILRQFPSVKIVLATDCLTPAWLEQAAGSGAAGLLSKDISPQALKHSLNLVLTGEQIVPMATPRSARTALGRLPVDCVLVASVDPAGDALAALAGRESPATPKCTVTPLRATPNVTEPPHRDQDDLPSTALASLSAREKEILDCLAGGLSNKLIARQLDVAEATVKVHVRTLLRKLRAKNRTQAAIWSIRSNAASRAPLRPELIAVGEMPSIGKPLALRLRDPHRDRSPGPL
jgi:two-component system nitrate/nitrite response regulator NarL